MVQDAAGGKISMTTAANSWDRTIMPYGKELGLLTGYVKAQSGTSKRTQAGNADLQRKWYMTQDEVFDAVRARAMEVLQDADLVEKLMPYLINNLDEECLQASAKNELVVGSKRTNKHNNQNNSSR